MQIASKHTLLYQPCVLQKSIIRLFHLTWIRRKKDKSYTSCQDIFPLIDIKLRKLQIHMTYKGLLKVR